MAFDTLAKVIEMNGHGVYVWASVAFACTLLGLTVLLPWLKSRRLLSELKNELNQEKREQS